MAAGKSGGDMTNLAGKRFSVQEPPELSVIIVNWNTRDLLRDCLNSVYAETKATSFEILVVDNASSDGSAEMVKREFPQAKLTENQENLGFARASNQAIMQSVGNYVLLLNPDAVVLSSALDKMVIFMREHPAVDASGPMILNPAGILQPSTRMSNMFRCISIFLPGDWLATYPLRMLVKKLIMKFGKKETYSTNPYQVGSLSGACIMMTRQAVDKVGLLDERYFIYAEEVDWFYRLKQLGGKAYFVPNARITHHHGQSTKQTNDNYKYFLQSKYLFIKKHHGKRAAYFFRITFAIDSLVTICAFLLLQVLAKGERRNEVKGTVRSLWRALLWGIGSNKGGAN
ncbi:MAG TPA: glycosyltransferase family 2 protein [Dehalococcoidia bacterium]|nr:glycosyltransferase family 2 protein [Dehalococcoidia bacterium]